MHPHIRQDNHKTPFPKSEKHCQDVKARERPPIILSGFIKENIYCYYPVAFREKGCQGEKGGKNGKRESYRA
jgi:hypothetical protein